jgi:hypothetical protein
LNIHRHILSIALVMLMSIALAQTSRDSIRWSQKGFFVNDSLVNFENETCWSLTKKSQLLKEFPNYELNIKKAEIIDSSLNLTLVYGGGCGSAFLKLFVDSLIDLTNESIIRLYPEFSDYDLCKASLHKDVCFDLRILLDRRKKPLLIKFGKYDITNFTDTIEVKEVSGAPVFLLHGKPIAPLSKKHSVLKDFPASNTEYLLARQHRTKAWRFLLAGAAIFCSTTFYRENDAQIPVMLAGGVIGSMSYFQIPKMKRHLYKSISIYNQEKIKQKVN